MSRAEVAAEDLLGAREVDARLRRLGVGAEQRRQAVGGDQPLALRDVGRERDDRGRLVLGRAREDRRRAGDDRDGEDAEYDPPAFPDQGDEVPQVHGSPILRTVECGCRRLHARARGAAERSLVDARAIPRDIRRAPNAGRAAALLGEQLGAQRGVARAPIARARWPTARRAQTWRGPTISRLAGMSEATTTTSRAIASRMASDCPSHADQCRYTVASREPLERLGARQPAGDRDAGARAAGRRRRRPTRRSRRRAASRASAARMRARRGRPARVGDAAQRDDRGLGAVEAALGHAAVELGDPVADDRDARGAQAARARAAPPPPRRRRRRAQRRATSASTARTARAGRATDALAREREAVRRVDQRHAARERERADRAGERGVQVHELGPALADEPAQRPRRGELRGRRAPRSSAAVRARRRRPRSAPGRRAPPAGRRRRA